MAQSADECFDVVNEWDQVVGRATRREVHANGLLHRAVHVFVFNAKGEVFLQKRSMAKDSSPGLWDSSASGHLESGEEYDPCAVRELEEELGLVVDVAPEPLFKVEACSETGQEFVWVYRVESEGPFDWNRDEIEHGEWFHPEQVSQWVVERPGELASAFRLIWMRWAVGIGGAR